MIESLNNFLTILNDYWKPLLFWDGTAFSGLAVTLWVLVLSLALGLVLAIPMSVGRVSKNRWIAWPIWFFSYVFRGTPLYVQILLIYSGVIGLQVVRDTPLLHTFFMSGYNCLVLASCSTRWPTPPRFLPVTSKTVPMANWMPRALSGCRGIKCIRV
ncbi:polar amino acid ABC transporter inner membrane subunit [Advenella kashmirensis WT001]|uniref:Polar amino acid ABC transporter inner membrane subunit n=1 Tax=Advenella kashmirensis (strain DSM 17095 / LMG 22695 / WT001) TaxID=1036672 RepID=I3U7Z7_ADVKW|nr:polar amino acid ABC transporter inner membrane subunit [Advenella kashmirensis WT001]